MIVLFFCFSCRLGSHSTSDDQTLYQDMDDVEHWKSVLYPAIRFKSYLVNLGLWDEEKEEQLGKKTDAEIKVQPSPSFFYLSLFLCTFIIIMNRPLFKKQEKSRSLQ